MKTTDIWFAAFLKLNGYEIIDFEIISPGKGRFKFNISSNEWKDRKLEFLKSDISSAKQAMQELKDLLY